MPRAVLHPRDVGPEDAARVLSFLNGASDIDVLAETVGLADGLSAGRRVAAAIIARRAQSGPFDSLDQVMDVTGINLDRFTEIVTALSGARAVPPGGSLKLLPATDSLWLGQGVNITAQILDPEGVGVPSARVTFIVSDGSLTARVGVERQRGSAVSLLSEPGGIFSLTLDPPFMPPLPPGPEAALEAELSRLERNVGNRDSIDTALRGFAERYRGDGSVFLREAVDRLFETYPTEPAGRFAAWPLIPVSVIGIASGTDGRAEVVTVLTLQMRNWLGRWQSALSGAVEGDNRLGGVLRNLNTAATEGADISREIVLATQAFATLEKGKQARLLSDQFTGRAVTRYLTDIAPQLSDQAVLNATRAVGAAETAIKSGGTAVFEAIRNVQAVEDTISPIKFETDQLTARVDTLSADFAGLNTQFDDFSREAVTQSDLTRFGNQFTTDINIQINMKVDGLKTDFDGQLGGLERALDAKADASRIAGLEQQIDRTGQRIQRMASDFVTKNQFSALESSLVQQMDTRIKTQVTIAMGDMTVKIDGLERDLAGKASISALDGLRRSLQNTNRKVSTISSDTLKQSDLTALEQRLASQLSGQIQGAVNGLRNDLGGKVTALERDVALKADKTTVTGLQTSLQRLKTRDQPVGGSATIRRTSSTPTITGGG